MTDDLNSRLDAIVEEITPSLVALRRSIHEYPELAFEELRTSALVADRLRSIGVEPQTGVGRTGVVGSVYGAHDGPVLGIRSDMDALPIEEATGLPFSSKTPGIMHACGHDAHVVIGLGIAEVLQRLAGELHGTVRFLFQPAEETLEGARAMIADGVLDDPPVDVMIGHHNWPLLDAGKVGYVPGAAMASSDAFDLTLVGASSHAAHPQTGVDPITAAAQMIVALQTIVSREVSPMVPAVLSIGQIEGGWVRNVIPDRVVLRGGVRALDAAASDQLQAAMRRIVEGVGASMRVDHELVFERLAPVLYNDPGVLAAVLDAARDILGDASVEQLPSASMGAEDFALFAERVPSAHMRIGSRTEGIECQVHNAHFQCNELAIPTGVRAIARAALDLTRQWAG